VPSPDGKQLDSAMWLTIIGKTNVAQSLTINDGAGKVTLAPVGARSPTGS